MGAPLRWVSPKRAAIELREVTPDAPSHRTLQRMAVDGELRTKVFRRSILIALDVDGWPVRSLEGGPPEKSAVRKLEPRRRHSIKAGTNARRKKRRR